MNTEDFDFILDELEELEILKHKDRDNILEVLIGVYKSGLKEGKKKEKIRIKKILNELLKLEIIKFKKL